MNNRRYVHPAFVVRNSAAAAPVGGVRTVIHRDGTFEFNGSRYAVIQQGPQWGYEIVTHPDLRHVADGYDTLAQVRDFVAKARREGWDTLAEDDEGQQNG